ncbi:hypothetical protein EMCRGX_G020792 [Ephydatia muelleri]
MQLALMKEEPKTLDDALKLACKHEMVETAQKHLQMLRQKEVVASTEGESSNSELLTATLRRDRERSEVETLRREVQRLSEKLKGGQRGRVDNSEEREKTGPVCWNCKSRGHLVDKVAEGVTDNEKDELQQLLLKYSGILSQYEGDLGRTDLVYHHIVTGDHKGIKQSGRRLPFHQREEVKELLDGMLERQVIEPSQGSWSSPVVLVKKKDGSTRVCVDFRQLNAVTKKDAQPLPRIDETLDVLGSARWFSCLDLTSGYWQVEVAPEDREKMAFVTPYGLFQFRVMPFGLTNAPATFQHLMERVLAGLHWTTCLIYLDDILIFQCNSPTAFHKLKERLVTSPILGYPVFNQPFMVDTDASGEGLGVVLSQYVSGVERVIAFASRSLSKAERKYCATRRVLQCGQTMLPCGGCRVSMNQRVKWLDGWNAFLNMILRWFIALVLSIPTLMPCPVCLALSVSYHFRRFVRCNRISGCHVGLWMNLLRNKDRTSALGKLFNGWKMIVSLGYFQSTCLRIPKHCGLSLHIWFCRMGCYIGGGKMFPARGFIERLQLVLPPTLVPVLLEALHSSIRGGHFGTSKTLAKVRERFYWVGQRKDVAAWCSGCLSCASRKPPPAKLRAPLQLDPAVRPLQRVAMDIMGPLPETSRGNKYILVIADYFTKWSEAYPIPNMEAITVAKCVVNEFICRFGVPEQLHSDQGRNFESKVIKNICDLLQIRKTRTSPYHPQSDGLVERFNRTLLNLLSIAVVDAERDWGVQLPLLMFAYRTSMHETNGVTPFEMMFGREVVLPEHLMFNLPVSTEQVLQEGVEYVDYLKKRFQLVHQYVRQNAQKGMQRQKTGYDQKENTRCVFRKGDHVWLYTPAVPKGKSPKFHRPWQGPYQVLKKKGEVTYDIRRLAHPRKRLIVHYNRLKPFLQASPPGEQEPSEEEEKEEKGTPSEEQESRGEEINKEPQESMADLQDEQYIYVETRRPEPGPAVEEHVPPPPLIAPAPRQPPQPPAEPELPQPGEQLRRSTRNRHPPHWYGHIVVHSAHTHTNCEDTVSLDGELCNDGNSCTHEQHY